MMEKNMTNIRNIALCGLFAALIAVGAFIKIPVPGIPFTLQIFFVLLAGLLLGSKRGFIAVAVYILIGLAGLPVFTGGGGILYVLKPTFGYIIGFALGAFVTGWIAEKQKQPSTSRLILAAVTGTAVIYALGLTWFYCVANYYLNTPIGVETLMVSGFLMPLPGDIIKICLSVLLAKRLAPIMHQSVLKKI